MKLLLKKSVLNTEMKCSDWGNSPKAAIIKGHREKTENLYKQ